MIDLHKLDRSRQDSVRVDGVDYKIHTSFPYWIAFSKKFEDMQREGVKEFSLDELDYLYAWIIPENKKAGYDELVKFFNNEQPLPNPSKNRNSVKGIDWLTDSEYINAAFIQQYGIDLIRTDLHWHDFLGLFNGLVGTKINDIQFARYAKKEKGQDPYKEIREAWRLPELEFKKEIFPMK